jgi:hypothetical protein
MPVLFIFAIIFFVMATIILVVARFTPTSVKYENSTRTFNLRRRVLISATVIFGIGLIFTFFSSLTTVSTKNVGIETAFGRTEGELSNGLHFILPWDQVSEMDAAIQTDSYIREEDENGKIIENCLNVRIANQQTACVDISIRWRIRPEQADVLYQDYHTFENVRESLVTRELTAAVNNQLARYNPLNSISVGTSSSGGSSNLPLTQIAQNVTGQMQKEIGNQIEVKNTIIPLITFDEKTQSRINQLQQQIALTRIAAQAALTAREQAKANQILSNSVNHSPNVLVSQCVGILQEMVKDKMQVPAGFSCWPGSGLAGVIASPTASSK